MQSKDYHDYVIKNGKLVGKFEEMYQNVEDPWSHGEASDLQYDSALLLLKKNNTFSKKVKILDIGCGKGAFTSRLKKDFPKSEITAIDVSSTAIKKAIKQYGKKGINFKVVDIQKNIKKVKGKYDLIVMSEIMWYILPNLKKILYYLSKNILKNKGCVLINQAFYKPGIQKYGNEFIEKPEDLINLVKLKLIKRVDMHNLNDFDSIMLFEKK